AEQKAIDRASGHRPPLLGRDLIEQGDARQLSLDDRTVDAIVTSPPYFVTYDYFDIQRLSYLAFNWPTQRQAQVGAKYRHDRSDDGGVSWPAALADWYTDDFRGEDTFLGRALRVYIDGVRTHLKEAFRVLAPGGVAAYSLANT